MFNLKSTELVTKFEVGKYYGFHNATIIFKCLSIDLLTSRLECLVILSNLWLWYEGDICHLSIMESLYKYQPV